MAEITITESNFEEQVLHSDVPVLLDFWAEWCGPCRMLAPIVAELADERAGTLRVGKVNVDEQPALAARFAVASIPTVILFRGGEAVRTSVGYCPKKQLEALIDDQ